MIVTMMLSALEVAVLVTLEMTPGEGVVTVVNTRVEYARTALSWDPDEVASGSLDH